MEIKTPAAEAYFAFGRQHRAVFSVPPNYKEDKGAMPLKPRTGALKICKICTFLEKKSRRIIYCCAAMDMISDYFINYFADVEYFFTSTLYNHI